MREDEQKDFASKPCAPSQGAGQGLTTRLALLGILFVIGLLVGCAGVTTVQTQGTNPPPAPQPPAPQSVVLTWTASTTPVAGYDIYRSTTDGGPYVLLNSTPITNVTYTDTTVQSGQTYFYVTTAVDNNDLQSVYSNQVQAIIP